MVAFALVIAVLLPYPAAFAADDSEQGSAANKDWAWSLAPMYLWAVSIDGDVTVNGVKTDLDVPFSDIWDDLNGALTFHFEGLHRSRWGFFTDLNYIVLNPEESTPIGDIDIEYTQIYFELGGFYRFFAEGDHTIDGLGGLRYSSLDVELDLPGPFSDVDGRKSWVDPFFGLRWLWNFHEKWSTHLRGDIGGFGIGSDKTYNLIGLIDFKPWKHVSLFGGYRVMYQDYSEGSGRKRFSFDATMSGPALGLKIDW